MAAQVLQGYPEFQKADRPNRQLIMAQARIIMESWFDNGVKYAPADATFVVGGPWDGSLLFVGLRGQTLYRVTFDTDNPSKVLNFERLLVGEYGRMRDIAQGPDKAIYVLTSNRDGRGRPSDGDDKLLRLVIR